MRLWKPKFIEYSRVPVWLSKISPITIWAIAIGPFVWCRGKLSEVDKVHETVHFQQQIELLFIGQWILYGLFYLIGLIRYRSGSVAYRESPFEREAYANQSQLDYLLKRNRFSWLKYLWTRQDT
jgi:hypothetical protein